MMRALIEAMVRSIEPVDRVEAEHQARVLDWIASDAGLFRVSKPATPNPHLVAYFVVVDEEAEKVLLVDHKNAGLWLPTGGHVEPDEHPRATVIREAAEELGIAAEFLLDDPLFVTVAETVGLTAGHTDVTLWFALERDCRAPLDWDDEEFHAATWFGLTEIPPERSEPNLERFLRKLAAYRAS